MKNLSLNNIFLGLFVVALVKAMVVPSFVDILTILSTAGLIVYFQYTEAIKSKKIDEQVLARLANVESRMNWMSNARMVNQSGFGGLPKKE